MTRPCLVALAVLVCAPAAHARIVAGIGGEGGLAYNLRDDALSSVSFPTPDHLTYLAGHVRVPYGSFEVVLTGGYAWHTLNFTDGVGAADLSVDDVFAGLSLRRKVSLREFRLFAGFGPAVHNLRYAVEPPDLRPQPGRSHAIGAMLEGGITWETPWPRMQVSAGLRHHRIANPTVYYTEYWIGFSIWPPRR